MRKKKILILGGGFGGIATLRHLLRSLKKQDDLEITLIDEQNFFLFSPLLHEAAVGVLNPDSIISPIRMLNVDKNYIFVQAQVKRINLDERRVITSTGSYDFDYAVLALGSITISPETANITLHNTFTLKTLNDSVSIKNHIIEIFEKVTIEPDPEKRKNLLTFVISGGGYTGAQLAASLSDVIYKCLLTYYNVIDRSDIRIILLESTDRIVNDLPLESSNYVMKHLRNHNVELMFNSKVTKTGDNWIEVNGTEIIPSQTSIWVTGVVANPRIAEINAEKDDKGRVVVNENMELPNSAGVYAIGDCAHYQVPFTGQVATPRAHHAVRQAKIVAKNIIADSRGGKKKKYRYADSMVIISLGRSNALMRLYKVWIRGIPALLVWVVAYSLLVTGIKNRFKITTDWILARFFGPDATFVPTQNQELPSHSDSPPLHKIEKR